MFTPQAKLAFERMEVSKEYHPFIMGANNSTVKSLSEATGARINIPPLSLNKNEITVAGEKESVAKAVSQITKLYRELVSSTYSLAMYLNSGTWYSNFPRWCLL